jgi:hypothetical protein
MGPMEISRKAIERKRNFQFLKIQYPLIVMRPMISATGPTKGELQRKTLNNMS